MAKQGGKAGKADGKARRLHELSDEGWERVHPLLPTQKRGGRWASTARCSTAWSGCSTAGRPGVTCPSAPRRRR